MRNHKSIIGLWRSWRGLAVAFGACVLLAPQADIGAQSNLRQQQQQFGGNQRQNQNRQNQNRQGQNRQGSQSQGRTRRTRGGGDQGEASGGRSRLRDRGNRGPRGGNPFGENPNATRGQPSRARPGERSAIPERERRGGKSTAGSVGDFPKMELSELVQSDAIYFAPATVSTQVGQRFASPIQFYNPTKHKIDRLDLWIRFNPELIEPVWINQSAIDKFLDGPLTRRVWREQGRIHLEGKLKTPLVEMFQSLVTISWLAKETAGTTEIALEAPAGEEIGIFEGARNWLALSRVGNRGVVSQQVKLIQAESVAREEPPIRLIGEGVDPDRPSERAGRGVHLALIPNDKRVYPGEVSTIDLVLINPDLVPFDELRVQVRFDPRSVKILDADEDNYISTGTNIYDGGFHETMPFENHVKNEVDQLRGRVDYIVRSAQGLRPYPSGTVARIVYRMEREAGATAFWFEGLDPLTNRLLSDVRARGRSLLGPAEGRAIEALHNVQIQIQPL